MAAERNDSYKIKNEENKNDGERGKGEGVMEKRETKVENTYVKCFEVKPEKKSV